ncbi:MAG: hypothetical protein KGH49_03175, partial [Candidatus Micrarchaeota archaeon]|nr:hypothetical protein [Candidatus Micrarchaeota archaeon]
FFSERAVPLTTVSSDAAFTWLRQNKVEVSHEELNAMTAIRLGVIIELERDLRKARGTGTQSKVVRKIEKDLERTGFAWGSEIKFPISSNKIT